MKKLTNILSNGQDLNKVWYNVMSIEGFTPYTMQKVKKYKSYKLDIYKQDLNTYAKKCRCLTNIVSNLYLQAKRNIKPLP